MSKKTAWQWCSKYIRLRDSIAYCKRAGIALDSGIGQCCTCGRIIQWKYGDAGHFIGRGIGGGSGVYWDERNVHLQCKPCNAFLQGNTQSYNDFMLEKYGQVVIDQLHILNKTQSYKYKIEAIGLMYKDMFAEILDKQE